MVEIQIWQFATVYLLLLVVGGIMKFNGIKQTKLLMIASVRMTIQLILAGLILTYIFENPHPLFTTAYILIIISYATFRTISKNKSINKNFKKIIACSIFFSGLSVLLFFVVAIVGESPFNPQYAIPLCGMLLGNTMTGMTLGIKTFRESLEGQATKIHTLTCMGVPPREILMPYVRKSLETALLPTLNSMVGMGIVALPGMMTGQILSGTSPNTAILYQISIMIAICTAVTLSCFSSLYFGARTLYNSKDQIIQV